MMDKNPFDLETPIQSHVPKRSNKTWAIAIAVSALFLVIAMVIAIWLCTKPANAPAGSSPPPDDTKNITNVSWVAPPAILAAYAKRDQNTATSQTTYYTDAAADCSIATRVIPVTGDDMQKTVVVTTESSGVEAKTIADGTATIVGSTDNKQYTLDAVSVDYAVNLHGVNATKQTSAIYYKQFGQKIATLTLMCKTELFEAKIIELQALAKQFTVKTES